jgi:putative flippase GtrA
MISRAWAVTQQKPKRQPISFAGLKVRWLSGRLLDNLEFVRFAFSGAIAACSNFLAVWVARRAVSYEASLVIGVATGLIISFILSKWYAFGVTSLGSVKSQVIRFPVVYCVGSVIYWGVAVVVSSKLKGNLLDSRTGETLGVLVGAAAMMFTTYLGHRYFTYRTYRGTSGDVST